MNKSNPLSLVDLRPDSVIYIRFDFNKKNHFPATLWNIPNAMNIAYLNKQLESCGSKYFEKQHMNAHSIVQNGMLNCPICCFVALFG